MKDKQLVTEWIKEKIMEWELDFNSHIEIPTHVLLSIIEEAKTKEKQQITEAHISGQNHLLEGSRIEEYRGAEKYFKRKYNNDCECNLILYPDQKQECDQICCEK